MLFILTTFAGQIIIVIPKVADFCPRNKQKRIWKPQLLLSMQNEQEQMTKHSLSSLSIWNGEPQWCILTLAEDGLKKRAITTVSEVLIQYFLCRASESKMSLSISPKDRTSEIFFSRTGFHWEITFLWNKHFPWEHTSWSETYCHCWKSCKLQRFVKTETA